MKIRPLLSQTLVIALTLCLTACISQGKTAPTASTNLNTTQTSLKSAPSEITAKMSTDSLLSTQTAANTLSSESLAPQTQVHLTALKGPTAMGIAHYVDNVIERQPEDTPQITFNMETTPDKVVAALMKKEVDLAMVPANLAATLYNKSNGEIQVAAINCLNVLYFIAKTDSLSSIQDLRGKTIVLTGKGATPDIILQRLLQEAGLDPMKDVTLEYKSEAAEAGAYLTKNTGAVGFLPQPFATALSLQNKDVSVWQSADQLWREALGPDAEIVTGVLVARKTFIADNSLWFNDFLKAYQASIAFTDTHVEEAAELIEKMGIVKKALAQKALPHSGLTYLDGTAMKDKLSSYLSILAEANPQVIGGKLPADDFYYQGR